MNPVRISVLASAVGIALFGMGISSDMYAAQPASSAISAQANQGETLAGSYIITFVEPGAVSYKGGVAGLARTAPQSDLVAVNPSRKLDVNSSAVKSYQQHLAEQRAIHINDIDQALGRVITVHYTYSITRNGISADMSAAEAAAIAKLPGIKSVEAVKILHTDTFRGPKFIGADKIWDGTAVPSYDSATMGEGIKVGVIDTGTYIGHPSFANDPACGFSAAKPKLHPRDCTSTDTNGECNGTDPDAPAGQGHGVHTASTAAGNTIDNTATPPPLLPDGVSMSGVAPCATLYPYRTAQADGSLTSAALTAAIQQIVIDQVDVVNYSIGPTCGGGNPWEESTDFLAAESADVFVAASAGNTRSTCTDPTGLVANNGPWMMTVAASTQDQIAAPVLSATGPGTPPALAQNIALISGSTTKPVADTSDFAGMALRTYPTNITGCTATGAFPANYFLNSVAIIRRGTCAFAEKINNAYAAGSHFVVITNNQVGSISMDTSAVTSPNDVAAFSTSQAPGDALIAFVSANLGPTPDPDVIFADGFDDAPPAAGAIGDYHKIGIGNVLGDVLAGFSFRGPTPAPYDNLTKPDITGPGVNIYAALSEAEGNYGLESGTSMSSPHIAGAAALVRGVHPNWSPMEVKSALQMTAKIDGLRQDEVTPWNADDVGSGRVDLTKAALAGLTMDESVENFEAADPSGGTISMTQLNLASLRNTNCGATCTWTRTFKNRLNGSGTWTPSAVNPAGYTLSFSPATFTVAPGYTQTVTITATATGTPPTTLQFGRVDLTESSAKSPVQHLTVVVKNQPPTIVIAPASLSSAQLTNTTATVPLTVSNAGGGTLTWTYSAAGVINGTVWDQAKRSTGGIVSSFSIADNGGGFTAADFQVTGAASSVIRKLKVFGFDNANKLALQPKITWRIYSDASGVPSGNPDTGAGAAPVWTVDRAPTAAGVTITGSGDIVLDLAAAGQTLSLPAGNYWLNVEPSYSTTFSGTGAARWNWSQGVQKAGPALLTGNAFGVADWTPLTDLGVTWPDVAFSIEGDVPCGAAWLSVSPTGGSNAGGTSTAVTATFNSTGLANGDYSATACFASNDAANPLVTVPVTMHVGPVAPPQTVKDPSFEASTANGGPNPFWNSLDTNTSASGGTVFGKYAGGARSGIWFAYFGGWAGGAEVQNFSQSVTFPATGPAFLNYWRFAGDLPDAAGTMVVSVDGTAVETTDLSAITADSGYVQKSIDVSSYANGAAHVIKFEYTYPDADANGVDGDIFIDDVTVDPTNVSPLSANGPAAQFVPGTRKNRR